jgi:hypothetical protein
VPWNAKWKRSRKRRSSGKNKRISAGVPVDPIIDSNDSWGLSIRPYKDLSVGSSTAVSTAVSVLPIKTLSRDLVLYIGMKVMGKVMGCCLREMPLI